MLKIVEKKKIWFSISIIIIAIGLITMAFKGLNFGIDFKGGTKLVLEFGGEFDKAKADEIVKGVVSDAVTNTVDNTQYEVKSKDLSSDKVDDLVSKLKESFEMPDDAIASQDEIGASIGEELTKNSLKALTIAFVAMLIYIAIRFEFKFGIVSLIALFHDILVTLSVYAVFGISINSPFIAAILTIVGYSINATIVIFDRIRENSKINRRGTAAELADTSINQTLARSINTTVTTLFTVVAVYIFVPTVRTFTFPITIGIISGLYSSVFIAPSLWVVIKERSKKKKASVEK